MKHFLSATAIALLPVIGSAQLGGVLKRVKHAVTSTIDNKVDGAASSTVSKGMDKAFEKKDKKQVSADTILAASQPANDANQTQVNTQLNSPLKSYSRFDFVPGDKVIYAEDFAQDAVGEFPLQWSTKTKGEVMMLDKLEGHWLRGYKNSLFTSINKKELGDDYTIEFDMVYHFSAKAASYVMPDLLVRVLNNYTVDYKNASGNVSERQGEQSFQLTLHPRNEDALAWVETYGTPAAFKSDKSEIKSFSALYNQSVHYAIQVQKTRLRIWINEKKVFDLPQAIKSNQPMARIAFGLGYSSYEEDETGFYVSNIRMAAGAPDSRHKLLETGRFSTSGILFGVNSDQLKPESAGILREIAKMLIENPVVRLKINGHTSSDGLGARNLELSKLRAGAVKNFLVNECGIDATRLETNGLGDTQPIALNTTQDGRMQNRRVEFIKL